MPAAELFGIWALPDALAAAGVFFRYVIGITDCAPAAAVINAGVSGNRQMRAVVRGANAIAAQWLAVHIPREWNGDADRLSHPDQAGDVVRDAQQAGLQVERTPVQAAAWRRLEAAAEETTQEATSAHPQALPTPPMSTRREFARCGNQLHEPVVHKE